MAVLRRFLTISFSVASLLWITVAPAGAAPFEFTQVLARDADTVLDIRTFNTLADLTSANYSSMSSLDFYSAEWSLGGLAYEATAIPEPATLLLLGTGLAAAGMRRRMKKRG